jgi:DHA2 family multidrug resistance protein
VIQAASLYYLSRFDTQISFGTLAMVRVIQGFGLPLFFVPLNIIAYQNLPAGKTDNASAMINLMRNLGGGIGISMVTTLLTRHGQTHQAYLAGAATHFYQPFVHHMNAVGGFTRKAILGFYNTVQDQTAMLSYLDVSRILMYLCLTVVVLVLFLRRVKLDKKPVPAD